MEPRPGSPSLTPGPHQTQVLQHDPVSSHWVSKHECLLPRSTRTDFTNLCSLSLHLPLPGFLEISQGAALFFPGSLAIIFSHADGKLFLKTYMWQAEMFSRRSRCLENGFPFVLPSPSPKPNHFPVNKLADYNVALTFHNWCQWHFDSSTYGPAESRRNINLQFGEKPGEQPKQLGGRRRKVPTRQTKAHCTDVMSGKKEKRVHSWMYPSTYVLRKRAGGTH